MNSTKDLSDSDPLLTMGEVAKRCNVDKRTVKRWRDEKKGGLQTEVQHLEVRVLEWERATIICRRLSGQR